MKQLKITTTQWGCPGCIWTAEVQIHPEDKNNTHKVALNTISLHHDYPSTAFILWQLVGIKAFI